MQRRIVTPVTRSTLKKTSRTIGRTAKDSPHDYEEFKNDTIILRKYANTRLSDVSKDNNLYETLKKVRNILQLTTGNGEVYNDLMKIVDEQFSSLINPLPYTIGAIFRGWNITTSLDGTEFEPCIAVRVGALQKPGTKVNCSYITMYADWNGSKFDFTTDVSNPGSETRPLNQVVINIPFATINSFPGFSPEEKKELKSNGIETACVIGFKVGTNEYYHLTKETFINIDDIKTRYPKTQEHTIQTVKHKQQQNNGFGAVIWVFFIFLILIIIGLAYVYWK